MIKKVISLLNKKEWQDYVNKSKYFDFYHYHLYSMMDNSGRPVLFVAEDFHSNDFIAFPLIIRSIAGADFFDCTSVYGFPGPISNKEASQLPNELILFLMISCYSFSRNKKSLPHFQDCTP